jgi:Caspase domain
MIQFSDHYAFRNLTNGSWFIQSLCKELEANPHELLTNILTNVTRRVAKLTGNYESQRMKQIPCTTSMLTKRLYFTKKRPVRLQEH